MNARKNKYILKYEYVLTVIFFVMTACSVVKPEVEKDEVNAAISIMDIAGFDAFKVTLNHIVRERNPDFEQAQHFYVAKFNSAETQTYMFWAEMNLLWIMSVGDIDEESWLGVRYPSGGELIDLKNDVTPTKNDVGRSTYRVTKDWAEKRLFDAVINGDLITVN